MSQAVDIYLVRYWVPGVGETYLPESVDKQTGELICKKMKKSGLKPTLERLGTERAHPIIKLIRKRKRQ